MVGHPLQMGVTVLFIMALCGLGGRLLDANGTAAAWLFFAALFIFAFGVIAPSYVVHSRSRGYRRY